MKPEVRISLTEAAQGDRRFLPEYASEGAAGADLRAALAAAITLAPGQRRLIPTGIAIALPPGFEAQIRARSGLALRAGIYLPNAPGTIDCDYRGEVGVILQNGGSADHTIAPGDRIAQLVISPIVTAQFVYSEQLDRTSRGEAGFGSTGTG